MWSSGAKDLLFQCDCANTINHTDCGVACTGVVAINHKTDTSCIWEFNKDIWAVSDNNDQAFAQKKMTALKYDYGMLPRPEWCNGAWQKSLAWKDADWILIHYNHRAGDTKKAAMKTYGHWRIPY
jgi:hypothetical protein